MRVRVAVWQCTALLLPSEPFQPSQGTDTLSCALALAEKRVAMRSPIRCCCGPWQPLSPDKSTAQGEP